MGGGTSGQRAHCLQRSLFIICFLCSVPLCCQGYPSGGDTSSCMSMLPDHGDSQPRPHDTSPFKIVPSTSTYRTSERIVFHVTRADDTTCFRGFYAQVRPVVQRRNFAVGRFVVELIPPFAQILRGCSVIAQDLFPPSTVTHRNNSDVCEDFTLTWRPAARERRNVQLLLTIVTNFSTFWVQLRSDVVSWSEGDAPTTEHVTQKSSSTKPNNLFTTTRNDMSTYSKSSRSTGSEVTSRTSEKATTTQQTLGTDDPEDPDDTRTLFPSTETVSTTPLTTPFTGDLLFSTTEVVPLSPEELSSRNPLSTGHSSTHPGKYQYSNSSTLATNDTNEADKTDVLNTDFITTSPYDSTDGETSSSTEEFKVDIKTGFLSKTPLQLTKERTTTERDGLKKQPSATFYLFSSLPTDRAFTNTERRFTSEGELFSSSEVAPLSSGEVTSRNPMSTGRSSTYAEPQEYVDQSTLATDHTKVTDETDFLTLFENTDFISAGPYNSTDGETSFTTDEFITDIQTDFLPTILFDLSTETGESTTTKEDEPNKPSATFFLLSSLPTETTTFQKTSTADILTSITQSDEKTGSLGVTSHPVMNTLPEGIRTTTMEDDYDDDDTTSAIMKQLSTEGRNTATATDFGDFSKTTNLVTSLPTLTFQDENEFTSPPMTTQKALSTPQLSTEQIHTTREKTHSTQTVNFFSSLKTNPRTTEFIPNESNGMTTTEAAMITAPTRTASRTIFSVTTQPDILTTFGRKSTTLSSTSTLTTVPEEEMMTSDEDFYDYTTDGVITTTDEVFSENSTDLNNGTTIITTTQPTTTRLPTTVQLTTTGISTTSPLSTTEVSTTSPLRTTETSTTNQLTTTGPLTTNQLTTTGPLTTNQLTTTRPLTTTQLTTTGALTTQLTTTEILTTSPLTPTDLSMTSPMTTGLSTTTQETTTVLSTTVQPMTTVMSKTPQVTTVGLTSRTQYTTTALSSTVLSTTPAPNRTSTTTAVSSSASPETNATTVGSITTSMQSSSRPSTTASTPSTSKGMTSNTPSKASSTRSSSTTRRPTTDVPDTPPNDNQTIVMIFTIGNLQHNPSFIREKENFAANMTSVLRGLDWRGITLPRMNLVKTSPGSVIAEFEMSFDVPLTPDETTEAVFVVYDRVNSEEGFDPLYNVTNLEVRINGTPTAVNPCFGTRCPDILNCDVDGSTCKVYCFNNADYCSNGATCHDTQNELNFRITCSCADGYEGPTCKRKVQPNTTIVIVVIIGSLGAVLLLAVMGLLMCMVFLLRNKPSLLPPSDHDGVIPIFPNMKPVGLHLIRVNEDDDYDDDNDYSSNLAERETSFDHPIITEGGGVRFPSLPDIVASTTPDREGSLVQSSHRPPSNRRSVTFSDIREVLEPDGSIGIENFTFGRNAVREEVNGNVVIRFPFSNDTSSTGTPSHDEAPT